MPNMEIDMALISRKVRWAEFLSGARMPIPKSVRQPPGLPPLRNAARRGWRIINATRLKRMTPRMVAVKMQITVVIFSRFTARATTATWLVQWIGIGSHRYSHYSSGALFGPA